jgi:hypothetical protein
MALGNWILAVWGWFGKLLHTPGRTQIPKPTSETSCESDLEKLQKEVENLGIFDLHDILRQQNRVEWCEWHLNIDQNDKAIEITNRFHQEFKKFKLSSSIVGEIDTIRKTFLKLKPTNSTWLDIDGDLKEAREANNPELVIKAYTRHQLFSEHINKHSAVNTYHSLTLYCTLLNCPILAHTQEYTEAFTKILFHPKLENLLVRNRPVYRGIVLKDKEKKLVENYKKGATIITTTFLSTSTNSEVAGLIRDSAPENGIGILCTYNINNTNRHTALDVTKLAKFPQEEEILILRYVPFTIESVEQTDDGRKMTVCFNECKE